MGSDISQRESNGDDRTPMNDADSPSYSDSPGGDPNEQSAAGMTVSPKPNMSGICPEQLFQNADVGMFTYPGATVSPKPDMSVPEHPMMSQPPTQVKHEVQPPGGIADVRAEIEEAFAHKVALQKAAAAVAAKKRAKAKAKGKSKGTAKATGKAKGATIVSKTKAAASHVKATVSKTKAGASHIKATVSKTKSPLVLGCAKCRFGRTGCTQCRNKEFKGNRGRP
jgi:hypothetical protein